MKRRDAFRKVRTICQRLDTVDLDTFPIWPFKLYLFGSVLTNKLNPNDTDMALVYQDNPRVKYSDAEFTRMIFYEPRLQPQNRASVELRRGMKKVQLYMVSTSIEDWKYLPLFPNGEGLWLIWKLGLEWSVVVDEIESQYTEWQGPRPEDSEQKMEEEWEALSRDEKQARISQIRAALEVQEQKLA